MSPSMLSGAENNFNINRTSSPVKMALIMRHVLDLWQTSELSMDVMIVCDRNICKYIDMPVRENTRQSGREPTCDFTIRYLLWHLFVDQHNVTWNCLIPCNQASEDASFDIKQWDFVSQNNKILKAWKKFKKYYFRPKHKQDFMISRKTHDLSCSTAREEVFYSYYDVGDMKRIEYHIEMKYMQNIIVNDSWFRYFFHKAIASEQNKVFVLTQ